MTNFEIPIKIYFGEFEEISKQLGQLQTYKLFEGADEVLVDVNEVMRILAGHVKVTTAEPERKTGKWLKPNNQVAVAQDEWICSSCHYLVLHRHKFCPECGSYNGGMR